MLTYAERVAKFTALCESAKEDAKCKDKSDDSEKSEPKNGKLRKALDDYKSKAKEYYNSDEGKKHIQAVASQHAAKSAADSAEMHRRQMEEHQRFMDSVNHQNAIQQAHQFNQMQMQQMHGGMW